MSTPLACAEHCVADPLCLSFDFETVSLDCYISHTDRYAHPEAYLDFPTGVYYEWQGVVDAPEIEPSGGLVNTQIVVRLLTAKLGAALHYQVIPSTELASRNLTASDLFGAGQNFSIAASGDVITLPTYSCKLFAIAVKEGMDDSTLIVSNEYQIFRKSWSVEILKTTLTFCMLRSVKIRLPSAILQWRVSRARGTNRAGLEGEEASASCSIP